MKRALIFLFFVSPNPSAAEPLYTGPFGPDGSWNLYQLIQNNVTWDEARKQAEALPAPAGNPAAKGHLVTFSSAAENQFMRLVNRQHAWCGLSDDERFGGHEAGSRRRIGWKWSDGKPMTFSNWLPDQPDDWKQRGTGEDGVFFDSSGRWGDDGAGVAGQSSNRYYHVVEWETGAPSPVPGAIPYQRVWPTQPVMPEYLSGKWNVRWVSGRVRFPSNWVEEPRTLMDGLPLLMSATDAASAKNQPLIQSQSSSVGKLPWLCLATGDGHRDGWLPDVAGQSNFAGLPLQTSVIGSIIGKIHVPTAGTHTFAIAATDAFALRVGGLKWQSATGNSYIDPLDPLTVTQPNGNSVSKAFAVIHLPAGDHLVEALWMAGRARSGFQILSAPGIHETTTATTDWRPLGHVASSGKVPALGITEPGWTVECLPPADKPLELQEGLLKLNLSMTPISQAAIPSIHYADDAENGASVFPNERPGGANNHWPIHATARLVVPKDGIYQIDLLASGPAALRIKGGVLKGISRAPQGPKDLHLQADAFNFNGRSANYNDPQVVTAWHLKSGEHDIEVFLVKNLGPASLLVTSCPDGPYLPTLLKTGGAGLMDEVPGLPHAKR